MDLHFPNGEARKVLALIDTGAEINVIHPRLVPEGMFRQSERPLRLGTANANCMVGGRREATFMVGMQATDIDSRRGLELRMPMAAYDGEMVCELIVSYGWLAQQNALVNPRRHGLLFCEKGHMLWVGVLRKKKRVVSTGTPNTSPIIASPMGVVMAKKPQGKMETQGGMSCTTPINTSGG